MSYITFLDALGLHIRNIEHAYNECENALTKVLLKAKMDDLDEQVRNELVNFKSGTDCIFSWDDATNSMIEVMFKVTSNIIKKYYPDLETNYYINGYDSYFYIMDDDLFEILYNEEIDTDIIKKIINFDLANKVPLDDVLQTIEIARDERLVNDIVNAIKNGNDFTVYESVEELGEDHSDNGLRELREEVKNALFMEGRESIAKLCGITEEKAYEMEKDSLDNLLDYIISDMDDDEFFRLFVEHCCENQK